MASSENEHEETGRLAGLGAGMVAGARIGTVLIPIPFLGTVTGAIVGGTMGSRFGRQIGPQIVKTVDGLLGNRQASGEAPGPSEDLLGQLERLGQLRTQGVLSDEEFAAAKARLLGQ
ncbi:MAG TPA: SHOCT domain-containing protein [Herpetosiphonaceae bacterium]|nr:SHOCT domain-containing protein [Herpetosiphonaceae bacterium]